MSRQHLFVSYDHAVELNKLGYHDNTGSSLAAWEDLPKGRFLHFGAHPVGLIQAPLYQQAFDFLREKFKMNGNIVELGPSLSKDKNKVYWLYRITFVGKSGYIGNEYRKSFEDYNICKIVMLDEMIKKAK